MTYLKAVEAGCDVIDTAMSHHLLLVQAQPATEVMVETFQWNTITIPDWIRTYCAEIADYFRPIRDEALGKRTSESEEPWCKYQDSSVIRYRADMFQT